MNVVSRADRNDYQRLYRLASNQSHRFVQNQPFRINFRCLFTIMNCFEPEIHVIVFKCFVCRSEKNATFPLQKTNSFALFERRHLGLACLALSTLNCHQTVCGERCNIWGRTL